MAEHESLVARKAETGAALDRLGRDDPGYAEAGEAWLGAKRALEAFHVELAELRTSEAAVIEVKTLALAALLGGRPDSIDAAVDAALEAAALSHRVFDEALALSIARDLVAA